MKKLINLRLLLLVFSLILVIGVGILAQSCKNSKVKKDASAEVDKAASWYSGYAWSEGFQLVPDESTNKQEFDKLYNAHPGWWDKAFEWLKTTDLDTIKPGVYFIEDGDVRAIVSEAPAPELENVKWEFHRDFSDIQYIVKGKAQMGVGPMSEATVTEPYDSAKDVGFGTVEGTYYTAEPGTFFIFTPADIHRPGIKVEGYDTVKKVVVKVRANSPE